MSKELIERVRLFISLGFGNEIVSRIEELEQERESAYVIADHYRAERDTLQADNARLRKVLESARSMIGHPDNIAIIDRALAATEPKP